MANDVAVKPDNPMVRLHEQLEQRTSQFQAALPAHIPVERFKRVILTAVQNSPALLTADRPTFFNSAMKAAQDGLLPDGREGAMVIYRTKIKDPISKQEHWINAVQWIPMIGGLRKKVRNSKELATWDVKAVYEKDEFLYEDGLDLILKHKPFIDGPPGQLKLVYSVAKLKSGEVSVDVMPRWQVDRIRAMSKAKDNGPWVDHYDEMAKKTVARRHSKVLPMSTDLDDLIRRDDELYDLDGAGDKQIGASARRPQLVDFTGVESSTPDTAKYPDEEQPAKVEAPKKEQHDPETGEVTQEPADVEVGPPEAMEAGRVARREGKPRRVPQEFQIAETLSTSWTEGWNAEDEEIAEAKKAKK